MLKTILMTMLAALVFSGCMMQREVQNSTLRAEMDAVPEEQVTHDCFKQLAPAGNLVGDKFDKVLYTEGLCSGEAIAVNTAIHADGVTILSPSGEKIKSPLYADGNDILVKSEGKSKVIGSIVETDRGHELKIADDVSFDGKDDEITVDVTW